VRGACGVVRDADDCSKAGGRGRCKGYGKGASGSLGQLGATALFQSEGTRISARQCDARYLQGRRAGIRQAYSLSRTCCSWGCVWKGKSRWCENRLRSLLRSRSGKAAPGDQEKSGGQGPPHAA